MNVLDGYSIALLLALVGILFLIAEVFFPSGGLLGSFAAISMFAAVYSAYTAGGWKTGLYCAAGEVLVAPIVIYFAFQWLPHTPMGKVLLGEAPTEEEVRPDESRHELVGRVGVARTKLLPAGAVEIDGRVVDCVSQSQAIEPGEYVKVVEVSANRVVVLRAGEGERPGDASPDDLLARPAEELGIDDLALGDSGNESQNT